MIKEERSIAIAESVIGTANRIAKSLKSLPKKKLHGKDRRKYGRLIKKTRKRNGAFTALHLLIGASQIQQIASTPIPRFPKGSL